tara:strand:- start:174 stop:350 length:177 start_codon:yes stop_codon:yes gene_type:complete
MINTVKKNISPITGQLCSYRVTQTNSDIIKSVPLDPANTDYIAIQEWVAEGNKIEEAD